MFIQFVILATPRTGSNWLCTLLDSHPDVLCHHELFNPQGIHIARSQRNGGLVLGNERMQREAPLDLLQAVWEHPLGFRAVGFKLNLGQSPIVFDEVLSNPAIRKIVVSRKNRLRTFVSEKIASTTGVWESYVNSEREKLSISVNVTLDELESHVARNRDYYQDIRLRLRNSGQTAMEIDYETLGDYKLWSRILRYLKVDPEVVLKGSTARMNDVALNRIISNYDELSRELSGHELEQDIS